MKAVFITIFALLAVNLASAQELEPPEAQYQPVTSHEQVEGEWVSQRLDLSMWIPFVDDYYAVSTFEFSESRLKIKNKCTAEYEGMWSWKPKTKDLNASLRVKIKYTDEGVLYLNSREKETKAQLFRGKVKLSCSVSVEEGGVMKLMISPDGNTLKTVSEDPEDEVLTLTRVQD